MNNKLNSGVNLSTLLSATPEQLLVHTDTVPVVWLVNYLEYHKYQSGVRIMAQVETALEDLLPKLNSGNCPQQEEVDVVQMQYLLEGLADTYEIHGAELLAKLLADYDGSNEDVIS